MSKTTNIPSRLFLTIAIPVELTVMLLITGLVVGVFFSRSNSHNTQDWTIP